MRVGIGYDIHRLIFTDVDSSIPVGGIPIPCHKRVEAHSDGDALVHSIVDACLGALALGDIGQRYSDQAEENKNRSSSEFLSEVMAEVWRMGWEVNQVDSVVIVESPKLSPYIDRIRQQLARLMNIELSSVSVKAKTAEGLGPIGERRAIEAHAIVTLRKKTHD